MIINDVVHKDVTFSNVPYALDYEAQSNFLSSITDKMKTTNKSKLKL